MLNLSQAAAALNSPLLGADAAFTSVSTDTRTIEPGALFIALRGERVDGHDYLELALEKGAAGALVDRAANLTASPLSSRLPLIEVHDTRVALGQLAHDWRGRFSIPVIAVTGSNGKTTVKEMIAACLRAHFGPANVLATAGNFNNDIGLPLTLLRLHADHRVAVVELGMNHPGETAHLAALAEPTVALINNAQREHQEFMKDVAAVAEEHGAVIAALPADGTAVINADDEHAGYWRTLAGHRTVLSFGTEPNASVSAQYRLGPVSSAVDLLSSLGRATFELRAAGLHNVRNALAAIAASGAVGVPVATAARALGDFEPVKGRLQAKQGRNGSLIIDDTYNANPDSVRTAIDVLAKNRALKVLVLGDMGEVGDQGPAFHEEIGLYAREHGIDRLLGLGPLTKTAVAAFGPAGKHFENVDDLISAASELLDTAPAVLVKGSRFMRMERVVDALLPSVPSSD
ncbi:UDP-N-acetylmuramoyl-tripeptide--D-alanyl-D-alanine ligase [Methylotetracoccus oryzae]|uniref:UDP-N-acetylmuramoyl-tripeptide--D-alanyl-D- alanine ligase n=1 Tax=Methylotetracoccus oryzae TaxID=1919059 RepID=UPI001118C330|nr:UDP-N-acetylmuramoyl-tripeptide--D-alanyl-D-alanine ligase [Methylotetracoccus oryzae]